MTSTTPPEGVLQLGDELRAADLATRFGEAIRFRTVSNARDSGIPLDEAAFSGLRQLLERNYPRVHATLQRERIARHSLLYTWPGSDPDAAPILLLGHMDVVPVEAGSEDQWEHDPFGGVQSDGFLWGRGAIDNKANVVGILEAAELLLARGFAPKRDLLFAFGHDEEISGLDGAVGMSALLAARGARPAFVVDEGGGVARGLLPGLESPVAAVGIGEKGKLNVELVVEAEGGHSSTPPEHSAIGVLSSAIHRLERSPLPGKLDGVTREMLEGISPYLDLPYRMVGRNLWLLRPLLEGVLLSMERTSPMLRTTTAVTVFHAGVKPNVLPGSARAVVNFRIHPRDSIEGVLAHVRRVVDDSRVRVAALEDGAREPSSVSDPAHVSFSLLARTIRQIYPDAVVVPNLIVAGTDARHYRSISDHVYGFQPIRVEPVDLKRIHGHNERIAVDDFRDAVRFYAQLISNGAG